MGTLTFTPNSKPRKHLATVIARTLDATVEYAGAPSFAYRIGEAVLDRDWCLHLPETTNPAGVVEAATAAGFHPEPASEPTMGLTLVFPTTEWGAGTKARLQALLVSKAALITKSLGIDAIPMLVDEGEGVVKFPWFTQVPGGEVVDAVTCLLEAMIAYAKNASRINQGVREVVNEKYAMRCFLLRLGMIGDDTKQARRILMRNLEGNAAWKIPPDTTPNHDG